MNILLLYKINFLHLLLHYFFSLSNTSLRFFINALNIDILIFTYSFRYLSLFIKKSSVSFKSCSNLSKSCLLALVMLKSMFSSYIMLLYVLYSCSKKLHIGFNLLNGITFDSSFANHNAFSYSPITLTVSLNSFHLSCWSLFSFFNNVFVSIILIWFSISFLVFINFLS